MGVAAGKFLTRCLTVIPRLPCLKFGSGQPKHWEVRRKHITDGPKGAASMGASKAKVDPPRVAVSLGGEM